MAPKVFNEKQVAEQYSIAVQTLRNWRSIGRGPAYIKLERIVRYPINTLEEYFKTHLIDPEAK